MRSRVAWAVVALTTVAFILDTVFTAAHRPLLSEATWADHGWPLAPLAGNGVRRDGGAHHLALPDGTDWAGCCRGEPALGDPGGRCLQHLGAGRGRPRFAVLGSRRRLGGATARLAGVHGPDHRVPHRTRRSPALAPLAVGVLGRAAGLALHTLGTLTIRPSEVVVGEDLGNRAVSLPLLTVGWMLVAAALIASVVSLVLRLRRAKDDERLQLLWIASAAALLALGVVCILAIPRIQGEEGTWLAALPLRVAQVAVPVCVAVAVLRHRLIAIDLIVNRALMLALATGVVAVGYVAVVVLVGLAVGGSTEGFWPSLLATAVVALAFQPLRRRVVRVADRLAFGAAAAPYEALADFSRRLGDSPDPADLLPAVADAAGRAVNASTSW